MQFLKLRYRGYISFRDNREIAKTNQIALGLLRLSPFSYKLLRSRTFELTFPSRAKRASLFNCYDAFLTLINKKIKYQGPATDGLFVREAYQELSIPEVHEQKVDCLKFNSLLLNEKIKY